MIIVEGPDGAGKTTLIETLRHQRMHLKSLHGGVGGTTPEGWSRVQDSVLSAYAQKILEGEQLERETSEFAAMTNSLIMTRLAFDRFHLSEWVYGPILRHNQLITDENLQLIGNLLREKHVPIILCLPPFKVTLANVSRDGRERPSFQTEGFLHMAYASWQKIAPFATHVYDYTKDPIPVIASHAD